MNDVEPLVKLYDEEFIDEVNEAIEQREINSITIDSADKLYEAIVNAVNHIAESPQAGRVFKTVRECGVEFRRYNVENYAMLYVVRDGSVLFARFLRGNRDLDNIIGK